MTIRPRDFDILTGLRLCPIGLPLDSKGLDVYGYAFDANKKPWVTMELKVVGSMKIPSIKSILSHY
jgi:hypothetical protein